MNDKSPIFILIVLFVLIGLFYSPGKRIADQNRSQRLIEKNSDSSLNQKNTANLDYSQNKVIGEEIKDIEENIEKLNKNLEKKISENKKSPYADKIDISSVSGFYNNDPNKEYIYIYTNLEKTETIKITGWY